MNKRSLGAFYEEIAVSYLQNNGVFILERNFKARKGEIDIIGRDKEYIVFFEVKYRNGNVSGSAFEAIDIRKQKNIIDAARFFLYKRHFSIDSFIRFDCIGIENGEIHWIKNAFSL